MLVCCIFIASYSVNANLQDDQLTIDLNLAINNKIVQKSKIVTQYGKRSSATQLFDTKTGSYIEVMPAYDENNKLVMQFKIAKIIDKEKRVVSNPVIITELGKKAEVTMSDTEKNIITLAVSTTDNNSFA